MLVSVSCVLSLDTLRLGALGRRDLEEAPSAASFAPVTWALPKGWGAPVFQAEKQEATS